jgi:hypothetical protein
MILAAVAIVAISLWFQQHVRDGQASAKRESGYQTLLAQYATKFKPGMTRDQVERQLQTDGKRFRQQPNIAKDAPELRGIQATKSGRNTGFD